MASPALRDPHPVATLRLRVADVEIACDDVGSGTRPLVLIHGYTGFRHDFATQLPELGALGRTLAPDLRGHGESSHAPDPSRYTLARCAQDVLGLLDALGVERCDLLGHSMGGMIALRFALAHPERVASLVLMNTAARPPEGIPEDTFRAAWEVARAVGMVRFQAIVAGRLAEDPTRNAADRRLEAEWGERYWERHRRRFHPMDPEAYAAFGRALLESENLAPVLGEIRCPALVMVGEHDAPFLGAARELSGGIPDARQVTIEDAGHQPQLENAPAWLAAIRGHLTRVRS
jgi:2-succinyl-6-hydroxy-2,4-cyclohexadiene-1-carboxylate synthase